MRLYRIIYALFWLQTAIVYIDPGDRCIYVDPEVNPFEQEVSLYDAIEELNELRRKRAAVLARSTIPHLV